MSDSFAIKHCRGCGRKVNTEDIVFSLDSQPIASVFPVLESEFPKYPLNIICCNTCGLFQLSHTLPPSSMYTDFYGYRSGINEQMINHLREASKYCLSFFENQSSINILDIGCNDGTGCTCLRLLDKRYGIDFCANQFEQYHSGLNVIPSGFPDGISSLPDDQNFELITLFRTI